MPRTRVPTEILTATGAFDRHPERKRARESEPQPESAIGEPPTSLTASQRACYMEIVNRSHPGVLSDADGFVVELAAVLLERFRRDPETISAAKLARLQQLLSLMGLSPADRSRVSIGTWKEQRAPSSSIAAKYFS